MKLTGNLTIPGFHLYINSMIGNYQNMNTVRASSGKTVFKEHDVVKVANSTETRKVGIRLGRVGTIVHLYNKDNCVVEFLNGKGKWPAIVDIRTMDLQKKV